jgi:crotonobetainyl-CoA:carnitine CoA-transferase CaiB-like acyl-CoA transferase
MTAMFDGIRVVEVAQWVFVPAAGAVLANLGAEVTKIERLPGGDPLRGLFTASLGEGAGVYNPRVEQNNSGKRSLGIDLSTEAGREIVFRLVDDADVFLTNFRAPALARYGLDVEGVRARNPRIIYARGHGFGTRGPHADRPGYDASAFWARGGVGQTLTPAGADDAIAMRPAFGDHTAAMNLAFGIAAALFRRERTGETTVVDTSLLATAMWTLSSDVLSAFNPGYVGATASGRAPQQSPLAGTFKTADDRFIALVFMEPDRYWDAFCRHIGRDDLAEDERFRTGGARTQHAAECLAILRDIFASRTYDEWHAIVGELDAPWEPMQSVRDLYTDEQVAANGFLPTIVGRDDHVVAVPTQFDGAMEEPERAPEFGEHTETVLLELGYDWDAISALKDANVIV